MEEAAQEAHKKAVKKDKNYLGAVKKAWKGIRSIF